MGQGKRIGLKLIFIMLLLFLILHFSWLEANVLSLRDWSRWFFGFGVTAAIGYFIGSTYIEVKKTDELEDMPTILWEESHAALKTKYSNLIYMAVVLLSVGFFFFARGGFQIIPAPEYAIIEYGPVENAFTSALAGLIENYTFFGIIPTLFGSFLVFKLTKNKTLSHIMFFVVGVAAMVFYHALRYGVGDISASFSVAIFAFLSLVWVYLARNLFAPHMLHFFNNFGVRMRNIPIDYFKLLTHPYSIALIVILSIAVGVKVWRKGK